MKFDKNDQTALAGTILFHLAVLLLLYFTALRTIVPEDDGGILVNFGNLDFAAGVFEPRGRTAPVTTPAPEVTPPVAPRPVPPPREEMITQDEEETVSLTDKKEEERKKREEAERKKKEEARLAEQRRREEQQRQSQAIQNQVAGAFGSGNADGDSQGDAPTGTGNQGSPFGNSDSGANKGIGGVGEFNLNGRSIGAGGLPRPSYSGQEEGRIVINITVDPKGNVVMAEIGRGTNIVDGTMRTSALNAARQAKFNSIAGTNNQSGTITYRYRYSSN
ncbi:MAG: energy transducer TonB [Tannerella sp.]|jgi:TonB family protein|nr:energy transducer TonB [Tannerella sp.]